MCSPIWRASPGRPTRCATSAHQLAELGDVGIYVIDVGVERPSDFGLGELRLSGDVLSKNSPLTISGRLSRKSARKCRRGASCMLSIAIRSTPAFAARYSSTLQAGAVAASRLFAARFAQGIHQGYVKIAGEDALACDDTRWFTVEIRPPWRVLIAAPRDADRQPADYASFLSEALAPYRFRVERQAAFECDVVAIDDLATKSLDGYSAICLLDPRAIEDGHLAKAARLCRRRWRAGNLSGS